MELLKFQNLLFILVLVLAELSIFFVKGASKKKGTFETIGSALKRSCNALPGLKKFIGGSSASTSSETASSEPYEPKDYHLHFDFKERGLEMKLKNLKKDLDSKNPMGKKVIKIDRAHVFQETYSALKNLSAHQLLNCEIYLQGEDEDVWDISKARKWYSALMSDIFNERRKLYLTTKNNLGLLINPLSIKQNNFADQFRFVGKILAYGIHKGIKGCSGAQTPMPVQLGRIFLKTVLKRNIHLIDVEAADREFYNKLMNVQKYPTKHTFTLNGVLLKENGDKIKVTTNADVDDYMKRAIQHKYFDKVSEQVEAFLDGFNSLVPLKLLHNFKPSDLEILLYGYPPSINLDDWRKKIKVVEAPASYSDNLMEKFWTIMKDQFGMGDKLKLLYFITGTTRFEVDNFNKLKTEKLFEIYKYLDANGNPLPRMEQKPLPSTNISAKRLYLYNNESNVATLRGNIEKAIENSEPFE